MSRFLPSAVAVALALTPAAAAEPPQQPAAVPWANKLFAADLPAGQPVPPVIVHDFGAVPHGTLCVKKFTIKNIYDAPMQVIDVRRSCGCLEAEPPQKVLQTGESGEFTVTMNTGKFSGVNQQIIYVTVGPQYVSTAVLRFQANSRADVTLTPGQVAFGAVAEGTKPAQAVTVEYFGKQANWAVTGAVAHPLFDVDVSETARPRFLGAAKATVTVRLKDARAGAVNEAVQLRTNDPTTPIIQLPVTGFVKAPLSLNTNRVEFGRVKVGTSATVRVLVRAAEPFKVLPVADGGDGVAVEPFPAAAPVQVVTFTFTPTRLGAIQREVVLKTDLNGGATATVTVVGEGE